jgi:uncharacterized RDD family membrane protein YckC
MDQESETQKPTIRPPDLSGPPELSKPVLSGPAVPPPDLRAPDLGPPPPSIPSPSVPAPSISEPSFAPPPTIAIPEEAKKKPREVVPDPDEVKAGDIAPFNTRVLAAAIDYGVVFCIYLVFSILHSSLGSLASLAGLGYILTKDSLPFLGGQSIGKRVMKLRAVTADGTALTGNWEKGILRNAFLLISPVELVILLLREDKPEKGRRLGDDFAKTKVIVELEPEPPTV